MMANRKRVTEETWYDIFLGWSLEDERAAMKVLSGIIMAKAQMRRVAVKGPVVNGEASPDGSIQEIDPANASLITITDEELSF
jgi:hypothetical protein